MQKSYMLNIYKKHLKAIAGSVILFPIGIILIGIFCWFINYIHSDVYIKNIKSIQDYGYENVVSTSEQINKYKNSFKLENIITFSSDNNIFQVNTYVFPKDKNNSLININLKSNETIITKNISDKLSVEENDSIFVFLPNLNEPKEYKVKKIIPEMYDLYNVKKSKYYAVAFIGYDKNIIEHCSGSHINFMSNNDLKQFENLNISYKEKISVKNEIISLITNLKQFEFIMLIIVDFISIILMICSYKQISNETIKYYKNGFGIKFVKRISFYDFELICLLPTITLGILYIIMLFFGLNSKNFIYNSFLLIIINFIIFLIGVRKYGKAS